MDKLPCGHDRKYYYFHPACATKHRCIKCDDPNGGTVAMQKLEPEFIKGMRVIRPDGRPSSARE